MKSQEEIFSQLQQMHGKRPQEKRYELRQGQPLSVDGVTAAVYATHEGLLAITVVKKEQRVWVLVEEPYQPVNGDAKAIAEAIAARSHGSLEAVVEQEPLAKGETAEKIHAIAATTAAPTLAHLVSRIVYVVGSAHLSRAQSY